MNITSEHRRNGGLAKYGKKPIKKHIRKKVRELNFIIAQDENGEWYLQFANSQNRLPATDVEVNLWKRVQELESKNDKCNYSRFNK